MTPKTTFSKVVLRRFGFGVLSSVYWQNMYFRWSRRFKPILYTCVYLDPCVSWVLFTYCHCESGITHTRSRGSPARRVSRKLLRHRRTCQRVTTFTNLWWIWERCVHNSTIGGSGDTTVPSPRRSPEQPLPGIGRQNPLHRQQACPDLNSSHQAVGQIFPREGLFSSRPLSKRGQICDMPHPFNR